MFQKNHNDRRIATVAAIALMAVCVMWAWREASAFQSYLSVAQALIDGSQSATLVADESGRVLLSNRAANEMFQYDDSMAWLWITDLMTEDSAWRHELAFSRAIKRVKEGRYVPGNVVCRVGQAQRSDGSTFQVAVLINSFPQRGGRVIIVATVRSEDEVGQLHRAIQDSKTIE